MWERVEIALPEDLAQVTTSCWLCPGIMLVGVMRPSFLTIPTLWGRPVAGGVKNLRKAPDLVTELQHLLVAPLVYAEAFHDKPRNQDLLRYLGFTDFCVGPDRILFRRSV